MMKILSFTLALLLTSVLSFSQTIFTYGPNKVGKEDFLRAYNKNKNEKADQKTALKEYLDLFIKFKLKVRAALDLRLDTLPSQVAEYNNFRSQVEESYLNDEKTMEALVQEAFQRSQEDIHIAHLFIPVPDGADSINVLKEMNTVNQKLREGESFENIVSFLNANGVASSTGDVGFITAFSLPYEYENIVYGLKPNTSSLPNRAKNGFHAFRRLESRKAAGKMKAEQILIALPADASASQRAAAKKTADSVYAALKAGANFEEMAKAVSNDKMTYMTGGVMPEFGTGKYDPSFEAKAFALEINGEFTEPFLSSFGYHIVKRIDRTPVSADPKDANTIFQVKQQVQQDARMQVAKNKFVSDMLQKIGYKKNNTDAKVIWAITDSVIANPNYDLKNSKLLPNTLLFSFTNKKVTLAEWLNYIKENKYSLSSTSPEGFADMMEKYVEARGTEYYRKRLEEFSPEFKYQLQEFKDGNMLFEVMERNIWNKASNDTTGLLKFYNQNKKNYTWAASANAILVTAATAKLATEAANAIRNGQDYHKILEEHLNELQYDSGRYELSQLPAPAGSKFEKGTVTPPLVNEGDGTASFAIILNLYPANQQRSFEEARGLVINDYQVLLEESWIASLKKKYPVKVNEWVFQNLLK